MLIVPMFASLVVDTLWSFALATQLNSAYSSPRVLDSKLYRLEGTEMIRPLLLSLAPLRVTLVVYDYRTAGRPAGGSRTLG
jgi:hypothetical protein